MTFEEIKKVIPDVEHWLSPILTTQRDVALREKGLRTHLYSKVIPCIDLEKFTGYFLFDNFGNTEQDCCITASFRFQIYHISEGLLGVNMDMLDIRKVKKGLRFCFCPNHAYKLEADLTEEDMEYFLRVWEGKWLIAP